MNLGIPCSNGDSYAASASTGSACNCFAASRAAGRCCCRLGTTSPGEGCCGAKPAPKVKSCCAKRLGTVDTPSQAELVRQAHETITAIGSCPCGDPEQPPILMCPQPRIVASAIVLQEALLLNRQIYSTSSTPCGDRPRPCVPPPKCFLV